MFVNKKLSSLLVFVLTVFIVIGLALAAVIYINYSENKVEASKAVWSHFMNLSILAVGYFYSTK